MQEKNFILNAVHKGTAFLKKVKNLHKFNNPDRAPNPVRVVHFFLDYSP